MPDAFISYSRRNIAFARLLIDSLEKHDINVWIDWQDIPPSTDWLAEVYEAIENSDSFIFLISETSVISEICSLEISHAVKNNKRIIPIVVSNVEPSEVPAPLVHLQWIFFDQEDRYSDAVDDLITTIQVDQNWVKSHTRLQNRALEWHRKDYPSAALLRGADLNQAEAWLTEAPEMDPPPTTLQTDYIFNSRRATNRRQRLSIIVAGAGIAITLVLGIWAWVQRNQAIETTQFRSTAEAEALHEASIRATTEVEAILEEQAKATAQVILQEQIQKVSARFLASQSLSERGEHLDLGLLLAIEGVRLEDSLETRSALLQAVTAQPYLERVLFRESGIYINDMFFNPQGHLVATYWRDQQLFVFDPEGGELIHTIDTPERVSSFSHPIIKEGNQDGIRFNIDGTMMISCATDDKTWLLWETSTYTPLGDPFPDISNKDTVISISPTFKLVATLEGEQILIRERSGGPVLQTIPVPDSGLINLPLFSDDDLTYIMATGDPAIWFIDLESGDLIQTIQLEEALGNLEQLEVNHQGTLLGVIGSNQIMIYDLMATEIVSRYQRTEDSDYHLFFDGEGFPHLAFTRLTFNQERGGYDKEYHFLESIGEEGQLLSRFSSLSYLMFPTLEHRKSAMNPFLRINPSNFQVAIHRSNKGVVELSLYDPLLINPILESQLVPIDIGDISISRVEPHPGLNNVMAVEYCSRTEFKDICTVGIWDFSSDAELLSEIRRDSTPIRALRFHPEGELLVIVDDNNLVSAWNWRDNEVVWSIDSLADPIDQLSFSSSGNQLAAASSNGKEIIILEADTGDRNQVFESSSETIEAVAFHPRNPWLGAAFLGGIILWNLEDGEELARLSREEPLEVYNTLAFHPDGSHLASGGPDGWVIWNIDTNQVEFNSLEEANHHGVVDFLAFDPLGTWMISGNGLIFQVHDAVSGKWIGDLTPTDPEVPETNAVFTKFPDLTISAGGARLLAYSRGNEILSWQLDLDSWIIAACQLANRNLTQEEWNIYLNDQQYRKTCSDLPLE